MNEKLASFQILTGARKLLEAGTGDLSLSLLHCDWRWKESSSKLPSYRFGRSFMVVEYLFEVTVIEPERWSQWIRTIITLQKKI
jgi:hypothetical protein